ncbi:MAG: hypothetical protein FJ288_18050, partial [Planctomycetes bacterium]|nr:hypothetical protein [Planctomycetota bacterium]
MKPALVVLGAWLAVAPGQAVTASKEPLTDGKGQVVFEARRILVDADSCPRRPGRIVQGPAVRPDGDGFRVAFALDVPDDVLVRVVDAQGRVVRRLGCGVIGPSAPEPFQKDTLRQEIAWDGKDQAGRPAPPGCRVQVAVGLTPRFERFVGYDPAQLLSRIIWLEVDPQGRLYVQVGAGRKTDPGILRFSREGAYVDMVYPSNPRTLEAIGKRLEEVWPFVVEYEGETMPHRPRSWPTFVPYRSDALIPFPMRIAGDGTAYVAEMTTGYPGWAADREPFRLFTAHVDRFWFLQMVPLMYSMGPFAIDDKGCGYLATSTAEKCTGTYPPV